MKRTKSKHILFLLNEFEKETEDNLEVDYIKTVNPRMIINHKEKPYHYKRI